MHQARWYPKAVNLPGGRVLALGLGDSQAAGNSTYEIFDSVAGTWSPSEAGPTTSWDGQLVALADGTPLYLDPVNSARYDSSADAWTPIAVPWSSDGTNIAFAVLLKSGETLVLVYGSAVDSYLYDPSTDTWRSVGQPPSFPHEGVTSAALAGDGRVVATSTDYSANSSAGYVFDPATDSWSTLAVPFADLQDTRVGTTPQGEVIAVGGMKMEPGGCDGCYSGTPQKTTWTFDPAAGEWTRQADMAHARSTPVLITLPSGTLAVFGYYVYENIGSSELFGDWTPPPPPPPPPVHASIADAQLTEGGPGTRLMNFTVSLDAPARSDLHLRLDTVNGSATSPSDFVAGPIQFTIPKGATTAAVGVTIRGDTDPESKESFGVRVSGGDLAYTDGDAVGTILDDDFGVCAKVATNGRTCVGLQDPLA
jgi:hypothetical protein